MFRKSAIAVALAAGVVLVVLLIVRYSPAPPTPSPDRLAGEPDLPEPEIDFLPDDRPGPPIDRPVTTVGESPQMVVTVHGPGGQVVEGAAVMVKQPFRNGAKQINGESDSAGTVRFFDLLPGSLSVEVTAPGYSDFRDRPPPLGSAEKRSYQVRLVSNDRAYIELHVVSVPGADPIAGAHCGFGWAHGVTDEKGVILMAVPRDQREGILSPADADRLEHLTREGFTIPDGADGGLAILRIDAIGFEPFRDLIALGEIPQGPIVVELGRGVGFRGEFVDTTGKLIPQVRYEFIDSEGGRFRGIHHAETGRFTISGMPANDIWRLEAEKKGYVAARVPDLRASPRGTPLRVVMKPGHGLPVRVVDTEGAPIEDAHAEIEFALAGLSRFERGRTDAKGACEVPDLPAGRYVMHVSRKGYLPVEQAVTVPAEETIVVTLDRGHRVTVRVTAEDGEPIPDALVRRRRPDGGPMEPYVATSAEGAAEFGGFAEPTVCTFTVEKDGYMKETVEGETGGELAVVLRRGSAVTFRFFPEGLRLPADARVRVQLKERPYTTRTPRPPIERGSVTVRGLQAGPYEFMVDVSGYASVSTGKLELDGREHREIDITLSVGGTLQGFVFDAETGKPAAGASVRLALSGGGSHDTTTGGNGVYEFHHVLGRAWVNISRTDRCTERLEEIVVGEGDTVTIPTVYLRKGAAIVVRLKNLPKKPPSMTTHIGVSGGGAARSLGMPAGPIRETWRLPNFRPGRYTISFKIGTRQLKKSVTIEDGRDEVEVLFDYEDFAEKLEGDE